MNQKPDLETPSRSDKIRYHVDLFLSRGPIARFAGLFGVSAVLVAICAGLAKLASPSDSDLSGDFLEAMWWAMIRVVDSGGMADDKGFLVRAIAVLATISGVMVVAMLIGLVSSTVADKLEDLSRGKSPVIDEGHTLILGYGDKIFPILRELREANANKKRDTIVILSEVDKTQVEEEIRERMGGMRTTRVVVRQGSSFSPHDLKKVGAGRARSIIVLSNDVGADGEGEGDADLNAIKTLLALRRVPGALVKNHAVVELLDGARAPVVEKLGQGGVEVVAMRETLARLMVQTSRQSGLAGVYRELLAFEGSELYVRRMPELDGLPFGRVHTVLRGGIAVGVRRQAAAGSLEIIINPGADAVLKAGDELLVLAQDDDAFHAERNAPVEVPQLNVTSASGRVRVAERILICGFRTDLDSILADFDQYVVPGSEIHLMPGEREDFLPPAGPFKNLSVRAVEGDPTDPAALRSALQIEYDSILHVADDTVDAEQSDACAVIAMLMTRDLIEKSGRTKKPRMVSEILDPRTKELVSTDDVGDFVVSSEITSMLLAQVSEERSLNAVFADLFDSDGNEIYLKSIERYAPVGVTVSWVGVQAQAQRFGEIAIGCFREGMMPVINPTSLPGLVFKAGDKLVVIAEDDGETAGLRAGTRKAA